MSDDDELRIHEMKQTFAMECPYCDREETFDNMISAYAWGVEHIICQHSDELPDY
jgi:hypothetical protein